MITILFLFMQKVRKR